MSRLTTSALKLLHRVNSEHPWSHNDLYIPWVMRQARRVRRAGGSRALDVGCGTGHLLVRLAPVMGAITGLEPDLRTAELARATVADVPTVEIVQTPFDRWSGERFDLITFVAVLHHLPLAQTLRAARELLRPGGRLVVVGVCRETPADWPWAVPSTLLNPLIGLIRHPRRANQQPTHMTAPIAAPTETFAQVAEVMRGELNGVVVHRALFWRYLATWRAP